MLFSLSNENSIYKEKILVNKKNKIYVPYGNRVKLILEAHQFYIGHIRLAKLYSFLYRIFYWKEMFNNIIEVIK